MPFEEDFAWQEKFVAEFTRIARLYYGVAIAPAQEDWKRNTDFIMSAAIALPNRPLRISARARRRKYAGNAKRDFTMRLSRPSGAQTELPKMRAGWGDLFIYGVESEPGADHLSPWFLGNMTMLRDYLAAGGYYRTKNNNDGSSDFAVFHHDDMPLGFILTSDGVPEYDRESVWGQCRACYWRQVMPLNDDWQPGDGYWRKCLACGFQWRAGWIMSLCRNPLTFAR